MKLWAEKYSESINANFMSDKPIEVSVQKFSYPPDALRSATSSAETDGVKEKLGKLKELFDAKLITEQDYEKKRKEILNSL